MCKFSIGIWSMMLTIFKSLLCITVITAVLPSELSALRPTSSKLQDTGQEEAMIRDMDYVQKLRDDLKSNVWESFDMWPRDDQELEILQRVKRFAAWSDQDAHVLSSDIDNRSNFTGQVVGLGLFDGDGRLNIHLIQELRNHP